MKKSILSSFLLLMALTVITGVIYPLLITGAAQVFFPRQANGSLIVYEGKNIGSDLIGQSFVSSRYFHGRPSATADLPYNAAASAASNGGPTNAKLVGEIRERIAAVRAENALPQDQNIPTDLVSASGSGLDPHISVEAAYLQIDRVAAERVIEADKVKSLVDSSIEGRHLGILGRPRVNVLRLNIALDEI